MERPDLLDWFRAERINPTAYDLSGGAANEAYVLRLTTSGWEVFYSERGLQTGLRVFADERDAIAYFREVVISDPRTQL